MSMRPSLAFACILALSCAFADDSLKPGHSKHGTAFDSGMRTKPWKMEGIGNAPFAITTKVPEVQGWYDQANALLHSFWFEEAERSLRWCHKLEPENAMVYWSLARCGLNWFTIGAGDAPDMKRFRDFLKEAVKRKGAVTERERLYIEAWEAGWSTNDRPKATAKICGKLQALCIKYPQDIEAKAMLALFNIGEGSPLANEFLIQQVINASPMHPGAHHARIHNWDGVNGDQAIASCEMYGKAAPGIGHSLHMPGHVYTKIGMWHEAAIAMDSATRTELRYMNDRLALPFETWNYAHNRDYLCYIQEQLGMAQASIQGALDLIHSPRDPQAPAGQGYDNSMPLLRALVKFEMWDRILDGKTLPPPPLQADGDTQREFFETLALAGLGKVKEAREKLDGIKATLLKKEPAKEGGKEPEHEAPEPLKLAEARVLLAEGNRLDSIRMLLELSEAERKQRENDEYPNDPPFSPWPYMRLVGDAYADAGDYRMAIDAYERGLAQELNDAWCLAGLAKSWAALGAKAKARTYAGRFMAVWSKADPGLRWTKEVAALNLGAKPAALTPKPERVYDPKALDALGPSNWRPFAAPKLECSDVDGKPTTLEAYKGKNVLLVFYLSDQCVHCVEQLSAISAKMADFEQRDTVVLACSSTSPEKNKESVKLKEIKIRLLSDSDHANARRYASYDDFEDIELHSTILIDKTGCVRWKRTGGDPFSDVDFLLKELNRFPK